MSLSSSIPSSIKTSTSALTPIIAITTILTPAYHPRPSLSTPHTLYHPHYCIPTLSITPLPLLPLHYPLTPSPTGQAGGGLPLNGAVGRRALREALLEGACITLLTSRPPFFCPSLLSHLHLFILICSLLHLSFSSTNIQVKILIYS